MYEREHAPRAEGAEELRREFTANVSHELKTPITSISGYAEMMVIRPRPARGLAAPGGEDLRRVPPADNAHRRHHPPLAPGRGLHQGKPRERGPGRRRAPLRRAAGGGGRALPRDGDGVRPGGHGPRQRAADRRDAHEPRPTTPSSTTARAAGSSYAPGSGRAARISRWRTTASASPRSTSAGCSSAFTAWTRAAPRTRAARASASPSSSTPPPGTTRASRPRARPKRAPG